MRGNCKHGGVGLYIEYAIWFPEDTDGNKPACLRSLKTQNVRFDIIKSHFLNLFSGECFYQAPTL